MSAGVASGGSSAATLQQLVAADMCVRRTVAAALAGAGITPAAYRALTELDAAGGRIEFGELCDALRSSKAATSERVDSLHVRGFAVRTVLSGDRRTRSVAITALGRRVLDRARPCFEQGLQHAFAALDDDELHILAAICRKLTAAEPS